MSDDTAGAAPIPGFDDALVAGDAAAEVVEDIVDRCTAVLYDHYLKQREIPKILPQPGHPPRSVRPLRR